MTGIVADEAVVFLVAPSRSDSITTVRFMGRLVT
jgi:hypothetical protein